MNTRWTDKELYILHRQYPDHGAVHLQPLLPNRSEHAIRVKASKEGLRCHSYHQLHGGEAPTMSKATMNNELSPGLTISPHTDSACVRFNLSDYFEFHPETFCELYGLTLEDYYLIDSRVREGGWCVL